MIVLYLYIVFHLLVKFVFFRRRAHQRLGSWERVIERAKDYKFYGLETVHWENDE